MFEVGDVVRFTGFREPISKNDEDRVAQGDICTILEQPYPSNVGETTKLWCDVRVWRTGEVWTLYENEMEKVDDTN